MGENMKKIIMFLILVLGGLIAERLSVAEYVRFLEWDVRLEQAQRQLKEGMSEGDVNRILLLPADEVRSDIDGNGTYAKIWSARRHVGPLHEWLGLEARDEKSYMELILRFDKNGILVWRYYGG